MDHLRRIAIWVHETDSGAFRWVLTEVHQRRLRDLRSSEHEFITFEGALDEGADALKRMCPDLDVGPREHVEYEEAAALAS